MLSPAAATSPAVIPKPTTTSSLRSDRPSSPSSTTPVQLVDVSVTPTPQKSTPPPLPISPPSSISRKSPSSYPPPNSKPFGTHHQKTKAPKPPCPPLPAQQPSAVPKASSTAVQKAPPRPTSKPLSPPLQRPPPPVTSKAPAVPSPPVQTQKSVHPRISILEKLIKTCPVWLQLGMPKERATHILNKEMPGIFLVRRDRGQSSMVVSVRLADQIRDFHVKEERAMLSLEGSVLVFDNIFKLIAFYCVSRDILPCTLKLPQAIIQAIKYEDMEVISTLGVEFWGSELNSHIRDDLSKPEEERKLPSGNDRLWYINPISIEEYHSSLPPNSPTPILRSQSLNVPVQAQPKFKRPPPLPPRPLTISEDSLTQVSTKAAKEKLTSEESSLLSLSSSLPSVQKEEGSHCGYKKAEGTLLPSAEAEMWNKQDAAQLSLSETTEQGSNAPSHKIPPVPLRRRISEGQPPGEDGQLEPIKETVCASEAAETNEDPDTSVSLICLDDSNMDQWVSEQCGQSKTPQEEDLGEKSKASNGVSTANMIPVLETKKPGAPVPPPRRKRTSQSLLFQGATNTSEGVNQELSHINPQPTPRLQNLAEHPKVPDVSLFSPEGGAPQPDHDSYSTSSTEEEADPGTPVGALAKRTSTIILDRAKQRLSMVNFSTVFTSFMCTDRKLQKRIVELARDGSTYFGNLVQDYRAFTLDTMKRHSTSTEMLQEIRQMMTQLKSYLIQSTELQNLQEAAIYSEDKLEIIIEASLYKSVLKPLREAIYNGLRDIHSRAGNLKKLKENQLTVLGTTTTDLGVTTCVPDSPVMEKIQGKLGNLHQEYSPQKKIDLLLKTCKIIYESMSVGSPGKPYGADDFLPVLMYVLARCNISALLLDVEYMMELMDPALQLGEGSYYLTTTYGALEHIKNYDKQAASKQLSLEIQDSIHRWERRRTLNKAQASHSSIQDFITVSFLEACSNTKTLGVDPNTTACELSAQCAEKFEVLDPDSYCLTVLVDGDYRPLTPEELPLAIKSSLHRSEPRKEYYFVYQHGRWPEQEPDKQRTSTPEPTPVQEESLI